MSEIKRKKGESFESFMRRIKRQWQRSGRILQAKKVQFFASPKSRNERRKSAIYRARTKATREYLLKTGKLLEEDERSR